MFQQQTRNGVLETTGHSGSREAHDRIAALQADKDQAARARAYNETRHGIFRTACAEAGYDSKAAILRRALGVETDRDRVIHILRQNGVTYPGCPEALADAWARELRSDAGLQMAAE